MIRVVLDTNVVVSAHLEAKGHSALILELAFQERFACFASAMLFAEYEGVLRRPRFGFGEKDIREWMAEMRAFMRIVKPERRLKVATDPDDNMVLECALEARADYLV